MFTSFNIIVTTIISPRMGRVEHAPYSGDMNTYFRGQGVDGKKTILLHRVRKCGLDSTDSG
jgi:hypothetical protein